MMKITLIGPGRIREKWLAEGIAEYVKRLSRYTAVEMIEVADLPDTLPVDRVLAQEGEAILKALSRTRSQSAIVALDLSARSTDTVQFAQKMGEWFERGGSEVVFLIGGSNGLHPSVMARAQERLSLSAMTFTHQLTRLILLEQCYRAFRIRSNEPYHK